MRRRDLFALVGSAVIAAMLAACTSTTTPAPASSTGPASASSAGSASCNEPCILFNVTVAFTGLDSVNGSFVDTTSGTGLSSCNEWVTGDSVGFAQGPGADTVLDGKSVTFLFEVGKDTLHGAGTYANTLLGGVTIGSDSFLGSADTETINADGSGNASFANLPGGSTSGPQGTESGTVTWTCST
jgi:hypothetical protein